jgi:hypothetical protein
MDNSIREFTLLVKKLLIEVRTLNLTFLRLQESVESTAKEQQAQSQLQQTPPILRAELQIPEAVGNKREADRQKKVRREWCAIALSALTLAAVTGYAIITYQMWQETIRSALAVRQTATFAYHQTILAANSLNAAIAQFRLDQRAWVGPIEATRKTDVAGKVVTGLGIIMTNSGKTPGRNVVTHIDWNMIPVTSRQLPDASKYTFNYEHEGKSGVPGSKSVMQPSTRRSYWIDQWPSPEQARSIAKETLLLYIYGRITYDDIFGKQHLTLFCVYYDPDLSNVHSCPVHNDAN